VVLDGRLELSPRSRLGATAKERPTLLIATDAAPMEREAALRAAGLDIIRVAGDMGRPDVLAALQALAARGITRVMSEGGPIVGSDLIRRGLADEVSLITSPKPLARDGVPALSAPALARLADPAAYALIEDMRVGRDLLQTFEKV
jgi:diaminohydroxyphosphoribosylaminopyrimidine deaminase/5-amino-6-(5-phosphoribosylamino)uracil reductase